MKGDAEAGKNRVEKRRLGRGGGFTRAVEEGVQDPKGRELEVTLGKVPGVKEKGGH